MAMCVCSVLSNSAPEQLHMSVCVCLHAQLCLTRCTGSVAYGCVRVCVFVCSVMYDSEPEQWHVVVWVLYSCSVVCDSWCRSSADGCMCVCLCSIVSDSLPEQWRMATCVLSISTTHSNFL